MGTVSGPPLRRPPRGCPTASAGLSAKGRAPRGSVTPGAGSSGPRQGAGWTARGRRRRRDSGRRERDDPQDRGAHRHERRLTPLPVGVHQSTARAGAARRAGLGGLGAGRDRRGRGAASAGEAQTRAAVARGGPGTSRKGRIDAGHVESPDDLARAGDRQGVEQGSVGRPDAPRWPPPGSRARRRRTPRPSSGRTTGPGCQQGRLGLHAFGVHARDPRVARPARYRVRRA